MYYIRLRLQMPFPEQITSSKKTQLALIPEKLRHLLLLFGVRNKKSLRGIVFWEARVEGEERIFCSSSWCCGLRTIVVVVVGNCLQNNLRSHQSSFRLHTRSPSAPSYRPALIWPLVIRTPFIPN